MERSTATTIDITDRSIWGGGKILNESGRYRRSDRNSHGTLEINPTIGYAKAVTWNEVIRTLKAAGFVERTGKGSHRLFVHPESGKEVWVTVHGHDAGRLGNRILRDAGVE